MSTPGAAADFDETLASIQRIAATSQLDMTEWQQETLARWLSTPANRWSINAPFRSGLGWGKQLAERCAIAYALANGEHVHVASLAGERCAGGSDSCDLPRWEGLL